ncbi:SusC/RagA family TonB-linked outer membrane protein [Bacteroides sp. 224]|nr:SusC/RagA family TonB-linked outer membrane protein [Bacteroides sp. 224]
MTFQLYGSTGLAQKMKSGITMNNVSLEQILNEIEKSSDYVFLYNNETINTNRIVSVKNSNGNILQILNSIFADTDITYTVVNKQIILSKNDLNNKVDKKQLLKGIVKDNTGEPLIGVNVLVKGSSVGAITDLKGNFSVEASQGDVLIISYTGYATKNVTVANHNFLNIVLQEDNIMLDAVVVTALGIKRAEKALSYNVQQVTNSDLTTVKSANFMNSLAGKVAGVQINSSAAGPGSGVKVVMRGAKSITLSNNALYVIDGVPMSNNMGSGGTGAMDSQPGTESIADINPDDIESMSVLTGPSAAALYGYEGANGVVLITTKKGRADKTTITFSNSTTFSNVLKMPEFQNNYGNVAGSSQSWGDATANRYNPEKFFNTGTNVANTVSISTGNEKSQSYLSISANNAAGILPNNDYDRYNFSYRNTTSFFKEKLLLDASVSYIVQKNKNMVSQGQYFNPLPALYLFPRGEDFGEVQLYERYDSSMEVNSQYWPFGDQGLSLQNPYWIMNNMDRDSKRKRYMISASLKYNITDWLNVAGRVNIDNSNYRNTDRRKAGTLAVFAGEKGRYRLGLREENQTYGDLIATLDKSVDKFSFNVNVGGAFKERRMDSHYLEGDLDQVTNWFSIGNLKRPVGMLKWADDGLKRRTTSVFGNAEIGYDNFLYLTLTARNDWDSALVFSESKERSFFYPSVGLSGLISEKVALPEWFTYLKARVSFTSVGNSYDPYLTQSFYNYNDQSNDFKQPTAKPNHNLKPEITNSYEAGLNMRFFKGALSLDATYYISDTKNQTHSREYNNVDYATELIQAGSVQNSGIELALGYDGKWGGFGWSTSYTFTYNKNKIKSLLKDENGVETQWVNKSTLGAKGSPMVRLTKGGTMGDIYMTSDFKRDNNGYIYLDNATLLPSMVDLKPEEYKKIGTLLAKTHMGWRNSFSYKGARLNVLVSGRFGGLVVSNTQAILDRYGVSKHSAELREAGGVSINGRNVSAQDFLNVVGGGTGKGDYYVYKADNVRLQEVSLEYTLPRKWLNNIADITLGLVGNNLALLYCKAPFDPELAPSASSTYYTGVDYFMTPSLRNMGFSLKLQF